MHFNSTDNQTKTGFALIRAHQLAIFRCAVSNAYGLVFIIAVQSSLRVLLAQRESSEMN